MDARESHARDPVGFELLNNRDPKHPSPYPEEAINAIRPQWHQRVSKLREASHEKAGVAIVEVRIKRDGTLNKVAVIKRSGDKHLDETAMNAVRSASPFKPWPEDFSSKSSSFRVHLGYNQPLPGDPCPRMLSGVYRVKDGTTVPRALNSPDPEFSEDARKSKYQGTVTLGLTVGVDGSPYDVCILQALGKGLDERSIEAVKQWKFEPALKDGHTVPVRLSVETDFRLY